MEGAAYFLGPATLLALRRWPSRRKVVSVIGLFMMLFGLILASFATHVIHLVLTQGLLYGVGTALLYNPFIFYMDEWFGNGKGLAYSIFWAGTGISGAVMPFLIEWGLDTYGFETTLRAWAIFSVRISKGPGQTAVFPGKVQLSHTHSLYAWAFWCISSGLPKHRSNKVSRPMSATISSVALFSGLFKPATSSKDLVILYHRFT